MSYHDPRGVNEMATSDQYAPEESNLTVTFAGTDVMSRQIRIASDWIEPMLRRWRNCAAEQEREINRLKAEVTRVASDRTCAERTRAERERDELQKRDEAIRRATNEASRLSAELARRNREVRDLHGKVGELQRAIRADTQVINDLNARIRELEAKVAPVHVDARAVVEDVAVSLRNEAFRIRMGIIKPIEAGWVPTWMETLADRLRSVL